MEPDQVSPVNQIVTEEQNKRRRRITIILLLSFLVLVGIASFLVIKDLLGPEVPDTPVAEGDACQTDNDCSLFAQGERCINNVCRSPLRCGEIGSDAVIDLENVPGVSNQQELLEISDQYREQFGIRFENGRRATIRDGGAGSCPSPYPVLAQRGRPRVSHQSSATSAESPADDVIPAEIPRVGDWFLTDDGTVEGDVPCVLNIYFDRPTYEFSFDILDIDGGERWRVEAYNNAGEIIHNYTNPRLSLDSRALAFTVPEQSEPIVRIRLIGLQPRPGGPAWGLAFDNFRPYCSTPVELPPVQPPTIVKTGEVTDLSTDGATINYTLTLSNSNNSALNNVTVTDTLPDFVQEGDIIANPDNGVIDYTNRTITWSNLTVPAGENTLALRFSLRIRPAQFSTEIVNTALVCIPDPESAGDELCDEGGEETIIEPPEPEEELEPPVITKSASSFANVSETGADVTYTLTVTNPNVDALTNVTVVDDLASVVQQGDIIANPNNGVIDYTNRTITWSGLTIPTGATGLTLSYTLRIRPENFGTNIPNTVSVCVEVEDEVLCDEDTEIVHIPFGPDVEKSGAVTEIDSNEALITYAITVTNPNPEIELNNVTAVDSLPSFVQNGDVVANPDNGVINYANRTITWSGINLAPGETVTLNYTLRVDDSNYGTTVVNNVEACVPMENGAGELCDDDSHEEEIDPDIDATITKSHIRILQSSGINQVTYNITVYNTSDIDIVDATVTDTLDSDVQPGWVVEESITGGGVLNGNVITWSGINIPVGQSASFTYMVNFPQGTEGSFTNNVVITDDGEPLDDDETTVEILNPPVINEEVPPAEAPVTPATPLPSTGLLGSNFIILLVGMLFIATGFTVVTADKYMGLGIGTFVHSNFVKPLTLRVFGNYEDRVFDDIKTKRKGK